MSNIEKIRQEIERRKNICEGIFERESDTYYQGKAVAYGELLAFIDSLPEEKPSNGLDVTDFCKPIDPDIAQCIADHSWEMLGEDEKPIPNDLEEAAEEYTQQMLESWRFDSTGCRPPRESFIAGAKWQYQKDRAEFAKLKAKEWSDGYNEGIAKGKEQMMKDAVEGEIGYWNQTGLSIRLDQPLEKLGYDEDTKVEVIIKKKD